MMKVNRTLLVGILVMVSVGAGHAGTTPWMTKSQLDHYAKSEMVGKIYATAIHCKDSAKGSLLKFDYAAFPKGYVKLAGIDLFFRWNWLVTKSSRLAGEVSKMPRKEKRHLKWRIVQKSSYVDAEGTSMTCAIVYR